MGGATGGGGAGGGGGGAGGVGGGAGAGGGGTGGAGGSKGILVSTSRTGAARSAAILLISGHIAALSKQNSRASSRHTSGAGCSQHSRDDLDENGSGSGSGVGVGGGSGAGGGGGGSGSGCRSCENTLSMNRQLQKQLNHQRHLLSFELSPARSRNQDRFRALLGMNGIDNCRSHEDDEECDECGQHSIDPSTVPRHNDSDPGCGHGYGYGYGFVGVIGGYGDADTNGVDSSGGYATGAELHHLQIGALPTPASETPRFAVNQTSNISHGAFASVSGRDHPPLIRIFILIVDLIHPFAQEQLAPLHTRNKLHYLPLVLVPLMHSFSCPSWRYFGVQSRVYISFFFFL